MVIVHNLYNKIYKWENVNMSNDSSYLSGKGWYQYLSTGKGRFNKI